jgi:hypothetical protein
MSTATANIACVGDVTAAKRSVHKSGEVSGQMFYIFVRIDLKVTRPLDIGLHLEGCHRQHRYESPNRLVFVPQAWRGGYQKARQDAD